MGGAGGGLALTCKGSALTYQGLVLTCKGSALTCKGGGGRREGQEGGGFKAAALCFPPRTASERARMTAPSLRTGPASGRKCRGRWLAAPVPKGLTVSCTSGAEEPLSQVDASLPGTVDFFLRWCGREDLSAGHTGIISPKWSTCTTASPQWVVTFSIFICIEDFPAVASVCLRGASELTTEASST